MGLRGRSCEKSKRVRVRSKLSIIKNSVTRAVEDLDHND